MSTLVRLELYLTFTPRDVVVCWTHPTLSSALGSYNYSTLTSICWQKWWHAKTKCAGQIATEETLTWIKYLTEYQSEPACKLGRRQSLVEDIVSNEGGFLSATQMWCWHIQSFNSPNPLWVWWCRFIWCLVEYFFLHLLCSVAAAGAGSQCLLC